MAIRAEDRPRADRCGNMGKVRARASHLSTLRDRTVSPVITVIILLRLGHSGQRVPHTAETRELLAVMFLLRGPSPCALRCRDKWRLCNPNPPTVATA